MNAHDKAYHGLLLDILQHGHKKPDRTGTGTQSVFGRQLRFDLMRDGFPLLTTKRVHFKSIAHELLWFLMGDTNTAYLRESGVTIWDEWASEAGELGPIYGKQWRRWTSKPLESLRDRGHIDQIARAIEGIRRNPDDRGIIVSAWNVGDLSAMRLRPCHVLFQFYSRELTADERLEYALGKQEFVRHSDARVHAHMDQLEIPRRALSVQLYQRSADVFLGVPFNIASYALLLEMVAHVTGHAAEELVWTAGDAHIYNNHREQVMKQLARTSPGPSPLVTFTRQVDDIDDFAYEDIQLLNYNPLPGIKADVAV